MRKHDVGTFGIKPFASNSLFAKAKDDEEKCKRARQTLRWILGNPALTAPIPGLITVDQVKNAVRAVTERRQFDLAEARRYDEAVSEMWANLPEDYQWLKEWEWV